MFGKISKFGGPNDSGMKKEEGLTLYEHHEADQRPDLFVPRNFDMTIGTSKRLRVEALYFAYRFDETANRHFLQNQVWIFENSKNGKRVMLNLVDFGPNEKTGRTFDISPFAAALLDVDTDDTLNAAPINP